jgi:hypothetical protein
LVVKKIIFVFFLVYLYWENKKYPPGLPSIVFKN